MSELITYVVVLFVVLLVGVGVYLYASVQNEMKNEKELQKASNIRSIAHLIAVVQADIAKIETMKSAGAKVNRCRSALANMGQITEYPEYEEVVTNYDELYVQLEAMMKVFPVIDKVEKAYKHRFKGKDKLEENALTDALYEIQTVVR